MASDEIEVRYTLELKQKIRVPRGADPWAAVEALSVKVKGGGDFYLHPPGADGVVAPLGEIVADSAMIRFLYGPNQDDLEEVRADRASN